MLYYVLLKDRPMTLGTRQAYLPGGHRTGAPGKHVVRGKAKYRLLDENVRFFVAPPVEEISNSPVRLTCHHLGV
jgi:large subunit ribosomal protein L41